MLLRIAIVDDLPQDAERLQQALTAEGQTNIIRYESGDALLSAISPEQLDALFLDICMEGTNGIDTARKPREQAPTLPTRTPAMLNRRRVRSSRRCRVSDICAWAST